jgi:hypothetical protein
MPDVVVPFPFTADVFLDVREGSRALRVTDHPESGLVVVSIWHGDTCAASAHLTHAEAARLIGMLAEVLAGQAGPGRAHASAASPTSTV